MGKSATRTIKIPPKKNTIAVVNEAAAAYATNHKDRSKSTLKVVSKSVTTVANQSIILQGVSSKPENQMTPFEKMSIIKGGLNKKDLECLKEKTTLDYDKLASALSVTRATLINKKGKEKFNASLSERIVSLADIYSYGYEVFEDVDRFNQWMFRSNKALNGQAPYQFLDNQFGREEVKNVIGRIDHGVLS